MDILLFSERGAPLIHHYRVFSGGSTNISLCGSYMIKLRAFAAEAATRWAHHWDSACPAVTTTSAHPQEVWQQNTDIDLPLWKSRRAVSPRKPYTPTVLVSSFMPKVDIYDGRPPILPIWLQLSDSNSEAISSEEGGDASVATSEYYPCMFTPPGGMSYSSTSRHASSDNIRRVSPVSIMDSEPAIMWIPSKVSIRMLKCSNSAG